MKQRYYVLSFILASPWIISSEHALSEHHESKHGDESGHSRLTRSYAGSRASHEYVHRREIRISLPHESCNERRPNYTLTSDEIDGIIALSVTRITKITERIAGILEILARHQRRSKHSSRRTSRDNVQHNLPQQPLQHLYPPPSHHPQHTRPSRSTHKRTSHQFHPPSGPPPQLHHQQQSFRDLLPDHNRQPLTESPFQSTAYHHELQQQH